MTPSPVYHLNQLQEYFITVHWAINRSTSDRIRAYKLPSKWDMPECLTHVQSVSTQPAVVMSCASLSRLQAVPLLQDRKTLDLAVSHSASVALVFHLFGHKRVCPQRAVDFGRVISVFPFVGRKWNNNRAERGENHRSRMWKVKWALWGPV